MLKRIIVILLLALSVFAAPAMAQDEAYVDVPNNVVNSSISYRAHVSNIGWQDPVGGGGLVGTVGSALPIEALEVNSTLPPEQLKINYAAHVQNVGWQEYVSGGATAGTTGQGLAIEAIAMSLEGELAASYDLYYRVHSANFGWLGWAKDSEPAGTVGCGFPVEALEIVAVDKGAAKPAGTTDYTCLTPDAVTMSLSTHVQNIGWTQPTARGVSGTTGQGLHIEAIDCKVTDPVGKSAVQTQVFVQDLGWLDYSPMNEPAGTTGQNKRIEAVRFQLRGAAAQLYDINYRTHVANLGWMPWTANSAIAGTTNGALRVEAIDVLLEPKGTAAVQDGAYKDIQTPLGIIPPAPKCILISVPNQRMIMYENYDITCDTTVVTGMQRIDPTKPGDYKVEAKVNYFRTVGPGYDAVTRYWLTLYEGDVYGFDGSGHIIGTIGIHDASWRTDWSKRAYLYNGSHGCVNTPFNAMRYVFEHSDVGTPVIVR